MRALFIQQILMPTKCPALFYVRGEYDRHVQEDKNIMPQWHLHSKGRVFRVLLCKSVNKSLEIL